MAGEGVRTRIRYVDCDDGRHDDAIGSADVSEGADAHRLQREPLNDQSPMFDLGGIAA
jgi:hypothetical protein